MARSLNGALTSAAFLALVLVAVACGSNGNNSGTASTNAANVNATRLSAPAGNPVPAGVIDLVTTDNKFSLTTIVVSAGQPATVNVANKGAATHNWHVLNVKDDAGKEIMTPFREGGKSGSVTFTISKPGKYSFHCDSHPDEMKGQLVVQ